MLFQLGIGVIVAYGGIVGVMCTSPRGRPWNMGFQTPPGINRNKNRKT